MTDPVRAHGRRAGDNSGRAACVTRYVFGGRNDLFTRAQKKINSAVEGTHEFPTSEKQR